MKATTAAPAELVSPADVQAGAERARLEADAFVAENKVAVIDKASCQRAVEVRAAIGAKQLSIAAQLAKPKGWAYNLHRWFCSLEATALAPYQVLDEYERQQIKAYNDAREAERQAEARVLADQQRVIDEARAADEAAALERQGEHAMAEAVIAAQVAAPAPLVIVENELKTVEGLKFRKVWKWKFAGGPADVKQTPLEVRRRAEALIPAEFFSLDEKKIDRYASSMKESGHIPGVEIYFSNEPVR